MKIFETFTELKKAFWTSFKAFSQSKKTFMKKVKSFQSLKGDYWPQKTFLTRQRAFTDQKELSEKLRSFYWQGRNFHKQW